METIKIKKSFDFAGEEVMLVEQEYHYYYYYCYYYYYYYYYYYLLLLFISVEKEVPVQSSEAVQFIKSTEKSNRPR